jgi:23S rRNA (guanosine2251-2'-O)-methyltransferase|tara:strand:+ start:136 stop:933 length:798 start_codon:yes stop_codon:yes gene_type:complete
MNQRKQAPKPPDSIGYKQKKAFFDNLITVYGRNTCSEVLRDPQLKVYRLHLADSNRSSAVIEQLVNLAKRRDIEICHHSRAQLAHISRNSKQDQGVACDIEHPGYRHYSEVIDQLPVHSATRLIALDGVTNPQNLGMIIRSVTASKVHGLLLPAKGSAEISPLVIKASSGTLFKSNILRCEQLDSALLDFQRHGYDVAVLDAGADCDIDAFSPTAPTIYVLGNETEGVSASIVNRADHRLSIPMQRGVESLNVAVTAALVAFMTS